MLWSSGGKAGREVLGWHIVLGQATTALRAVLVGESAQVVLKERDRQWVLA